MTTTSDGITWRDWKKIVKIAADIANLTSSGNEKWIAKRTLELLSLLERLSEKYGDRPSILATRSDYIDDPVERSALLTRAFNLADIRSDVKNMTLISSSLCELYFDEIANFEEGERWLATLNDCLKDWSDEDELATYVRLSNQRAGLGLISHSR